MEAVPDVQATAPANDASPPSEEAPTPIRTRKDSSPDAATRGGPTARAGRVAKHPASELRDAAGAPGGPGQPHGGEDVARARHGARGAEPGACRAPAGCLVSFHERYSEEEREPLGSAYLDRGIGPARRVVELAAAGEREHDGQRLDPFITSESTVRSVAGLLRRRRAGQATSALASAPPRDAVEALRGRLVDVADTACWRRRHASIKSRQTSPTGDERQNKSKSGPSPADRLKESQLAAGRDLHAGVGRHRRGELKQQASKQKSVRRTSRCLRLAGRALQSYPVEGDSAEYESWRDGS